MRLPLAGRRVIVTRPERQAGSLVEAVRLLGGEPLLIPAIVIEAIDDCGDLDDALHRLARFDWVVFTSGNAVEVTVARMAAIGLPPPVLAARGLACVGPATAAALATAVRPPDVVPGEHIAEAMPQAMGVVTGLGVLFLRAESGREVLPALLREQGAEVVEVPVYRTVATPRELLVPQIARAAAEDPGCRDILAFASPSAARSFLGAAEAAGARDWARTVAIVCIGPVTARAVEALGYAPAGVADTYTSEGLARALASLGEQLQD